jgi:hypothetical protein
VGPGHGDWLAASHLESAADGEVRLLAASVEALAFSRPMRFDISGKLFPTEGLGGLSTFGDSLSGARFFTGETEWIS